MTEEMVPSRETIEAVIRELELLDTQIHKRLDDLRSVLTLQADARFPNSFEFKVPIPQDFRPLKSMIERLMKGHKAKDGIDFKVTSDRKKIRGFVWGPCDAKHSKEVESYGHWVESVFEKEDSKPA